MLVRYRPNERVNRSRKSMWSSDSNAAANDFSREDDHRASVDYTRIQTRTITLYTRLYGARTNNSVVDALLFENRAGTYTYVLIIPFF